MGDPELWSVLTGDDPCRGRRTVEQCIGQRCLPGARLAADDDPGRNAGACGEQAGNGGRDGAPVDEILERVATHDVATERDVDLVRNRRNHHPDTSLAVEDLCLDDGAGIIDGRPDRGEEPGDDRSDLALGAQFVVALEVSHAVDVGDVGAVDHQLLVVDRSIEEWRERAEFEEAPIQPYDHLPR